MGEIQSDSVASRITSSSQRNSSTASSANNTEEANALKEKIITLNRTNRYSSVRERKERITYEPPPEKPIAPAAPLEIKEIPVKVEPEPPKVDVSGALDKINAMKRELIKDSSLNGILTGQLDATKLTGMKVGTHSYNMVDDATGAATPMTGKQVSPIHQQLGKAKDVFGSNITLSESDMKIIDQREQKYHEGIQDDGRPYKCPEQTVQDQSKNVDEAKALKEELLKEIQGASQEDQAQVMSGLDDIFKWISADSKYELQQAQNEKDYAQYWIDQTDQDFINNKEAGATLVNRANKNIVNYTNALNGAEAELSEVSQGASQTGASQIQGNSSPGVNAKPTDYLDFIKEDDAALEQQLATEEEAQANKAKEAEALSEQEAKAKEEAKALEKKKEADNSSNSINYTESKEDNLANRLP